jgi:hypothetical protein
MLGHVVGLARPQMLGRCAVSGVLRTLVLLVMPVVGTGRTARRDTLVVQ